MEITNINNENSFDPTPKLKSSPVPILFIPFKKDEINCSYCGIVYSMTLFYEQKYCRNCLFWYIKYITDDNKYLDVLISTNNTQCSKHKKSRNSDLYIQNIKDWCEYCSEVSCLKQIYSDIGYRIRSLTYCKLCEIYNHYYSGLCSNCYLISSGWTESTMTKKLIFILYLPWWDAEFECMSCSHYLNFISDCQKWCSRCFVIYTGCRYCLTTNITFGITDKSQCRKCKRILFISINITPLTSLTSGNNNIDEFLDSTKTNAHQIADNINNFDKRLDVYRFVKGCFRNEFIKPSMKWIPYSEINNLEKIAEGGFGIIYKATCNSYNTVAIKRFSNSQDISKYFLNELKSLYQCYRFDRIIRCYGITKDPETEEYMMIMDYARGGNLHNYLQNNFANITWKQKLHSLWKISDGLHIIHKRNFIHRDFHSGNILAEAHEDWQIGDLGLSQPANNTSFNNEIYGVIPYIAPEIFKGLTFSKESDIYSMGMVMWEFTTGCKPFANVDHGTNLIYNIIDGKRPEITNDTPECFANLMKKCWDSNPAKRITAEEIYDTIFGWSFNEKDVEQFNQSEKSRLELIDSKKLGPEFAKESHPGAIYTSRPLSSLISNSSINSSLTISANIKQDMNFAEYISKEYELDINDVQNSSLPNMNSTIQNSSNIQHILIS